MVSQVIGGKILASASLEVRLSEIGPVNWTSGGSSTLDSFDYTYNSGGLVTQDITHTDGTFTYTYDSVNELTNVGDSLTLTYSFDKNGNRNMTGYITGSDNELTAANGNTYAYDAEGNMTGETDSGGNVWTYAYDYRDRMPGFTEKNSGGTLIAQGTYVYDALDRRIETIETSGGTTTATWMVYNGTSDTAYAEFSSGGTLEYRYLSGPSYIAGVDSLLARTSSGGTTAWYLTDQLGSVTDLISTSGTSLDHIEYDPFGNILSESSPSNGDQFKFQGMQFDALIARYSSYHRFYSTVIGRFVSQDPTGFYYQVSDLYSAFDNNPTLQVDPSGLQARMGIKQPRKPVLPIVPTPPILTTKYPGRVTTTTMTKTQQAYIGKVISMLDQAISEADTPNINPNDGDFLRKYKLALRNAQLGTSYVSPSRGADGLTLGTAGVVPTIFVDASFFKYPTWWNIRVLGHELCHTTGETDDGICETESKRLLALIRPTKVFQNFAKLYDSQPPVK